MMARSKHMSFPRDNYTKDEMTNEHEHSGHRDIYAGLQQDTVMTSTSIILSASVDIGCEELTLCAGGS